MKFFLLLFSLFPLFAFTADPPSVHGMLVFGGEKIFFSHLPMFHRPHDYQFIFEAKLPKDAELQLLQNGLGSQLITIVPRPMVLPAIAQVGKEFTGDIYIGHFERGGRLFLSDVRVTVARVIVFEKFTPLAIHQPKDQYYVFGSGVETWVAHLITAKPDYDQIAKVKLSDDFPLDALAAAKIKVTGAVEPLQAQANYSVLSADRKYSLSTKEILYEEQEDLGM